MLSQQDHGYNNASYSVPVYTSDISPTHTGMARISWPVPGMAVPSKTKLFNTSIFSHKHYIK